MYRVVVPRSVEKIEDSVFEDCTNLKEVVFEEGSKLRTIGDKCFYSTGLEEITLPKMLKRIGEDVFSECSNLKKIYIDDHCDINFSK